MSSLTFTYTNFLCRLFIHLFYFILFISTSLCISISGEIDQELTIDYAKRISPIIHGYEDRIKIIEFKTPEEAAAYEKAQEDAKRPCPKLEKAPEEPKPCNAAPLALSGNKLFTFFCGLVFSMAAFSMSS